MTWLYVPNCSEAEKLYRTDLFIMSRGKPMSAASLVNFWNKKTWIRSLNGLSIKDVSGAVDAYINGVNSLTSSASAQGSAGLISELKSPTPALSVSVMSKGKPSVVPSLLPECETGCSMTPPSIPTFGPSTGSPGGGKYGVSQPAIPASPSPWSAGCVEKKTLNTSSLTSEGSSKKSDPKFVFLKTSPTIYEWDSNKSMPTLKNWATALRLECSRRKKSVLGIRGSVSTLWRSPTADQPGADINKLLDKDGNPPVSISGRLYRDGMHRTVGLSQQVILFMKLRLSRLRPTTMPDGMKLSKKDLSLNPAFTEWLMGFPIGWTEPERAVTQFCLWSERMRGIFLELISIKR